MYLCVRGHIRLASYWKSSSDSYSNLKGWGIEFTTQRTVGREPMQHCFKKLTSTNAVNKILGHYYEMSELCTRYGPQDKLTHLPRVYRLQNQDACCKDGF